MLEFIGGGVVLLVMIWAGITIYGKVSNGKSIGSISGMSEGGLIKRFNSLVSSITDRNINTVKEELLAILKEYKNRKIEQFVESKQLLKHSENTLSEQIGTIDGNAKSIRAKAIELKAKSKDGELSDADKELGALYMCQLEKTEEAKKKLIDAKKIIADKTEILDRKIENFNVKYELKKTDINVMIATAISIKNTSDIDIKLNDLISEFNEKVSDAEIEHEVKAKINGVENDDESNDVDYITKKDEYKEKFLAL